MKEAGEGEEIIQCVAQIVPFIVKSIDIIIKKRGGQEESGFDNNKSFYSDIPHRHSNLACLMKGRPYSVKSFLVSPIMDQEVLEPTVDFINILRVHFLYEFFAKANVTRKSCQNDICTKNSYV